MRPVLLALPLLVTLPAAAGPEGPPFFDPERSLKTQAAEADRVKAAMGSASAEQAVATFVDPSVHVRDAAMSALISRNDDALHAELERYLSHKDPWVAAAVAELYGRTRYAAGREALEQKGLRSKHELATLESIWALERLGDAASGPALEKAHTKRHASSEYRVQGDALIALAIVDPERARPHAEKALEHKLPALRIAALVALGHVAPRAAAEAAVGALEAKPLPKSQRGWETRLLSAVLEALSNWQRRAGHAELARRAIDALIARLEAAEGLAQFLLAQALTDLTGQRIGLDAEMWKGWWEAQRDGFEPADKAPEAEAAAAEGPGEATTRVRFHGIPIYSKRLLFAQDVSGGMKNPLDESGDSPTKMAFSSSELLRVLQSLDDDVACNVLFFATTYQTVSETLVPIKKARKKLLAWVKKHSVAASGKMSRSNLYDSIASGMADPEIDTIFFLSEGSPTEGRYRFRLRFIRHLVRLNVYRRVRVHCLQVTTSEYGAKFLEHIASATGGTYYALDFLRRARGK